MHSRASLELQFWVSGILFVPTMIAAACSAMCWAILYWLLCADPSMQPSLHQAEYNALHFGLWTLPAIFIGPLLLVLAHRAFVLLDMLDDSNQKP